ncbi:MAG: trypsin-like peptidase domain-containing protein [Gammaproteobacteria bacterium]
MSTDPDRWRLKPIDVPGLPEYLEIPDEGLTLGRDQAADVLIDPERFPYISSRHARFAFEDYELIVEDLDSKNGTLVNNQEIKRRKLKPGDVIQLGPEIGARFLVASRFAGTHTFRIPKALSSAAHVSDSALLNVKAALGKVGRERTRKTRLMVLGLFTLVAAGAGYAFYTLSQQQQNIREDLLTRQEELRGISDTLAQQNLDREQQKTQLETDRNDLLTKLEALEQNGRASTEEIGKLREELETANAKLEQYDPINLEKIEQGKREQLEQILKAVVFIDTALAFREKDGDRWLHRPDLPGEPLRELSSEEELFYEESGTGSGFCVSGEGWIITNAHVVVPPDPEESVPFFQGTELEPVPYRKVVFSGTSARHAAKVHAVADEGDDDFAVIKVEGFDGIPHIGNFTTDVAAPSPGNEVRLFGFPLGRAIMQDEDILQASVFEGIISRQVGSFLQVQSSVYPGNSGGPVVDEHGKVIGIVTGVQTVPGGQIASDIGYVIPVSTVSKIWSSVQ